MSVSLFVRTGIKMRCKHCNKPINKIGDGVYYCDDCDRILVDKEELTY